jgi:hypothetical protein
MGPKTLMKCSIPHQLPVDSTRGAICQFCGAFRQEPLSGPVYCFNIRFSDIPGSKVWLFATRYHSVVHVGNESGFCAP